MYRLISDLKMSQLLPDTNSTRHILMVTAEEIMAEQGLELPPLHVIASEAGLKNKDAVQYHFRDRSGLIHAILNKRAEAISLRRGELLLEAAAQDMLKNVGALIEAMYLPIIEQVGPTHKRAPARFLLLAMTQAWASNSMAFLPDVQEDPNTNRILSLLEGLLPHLSRQRLSWRLRVQTRTILTCLVENDNFCRQGVGATSEDELMVEALKMIEGAIASS